MTRRLSPNTLNTLVAVLSCENLGLTAEQINTALMNSTGLIETGSENELRPDEVYLVIDNQNGNDPVSLDSREALDAHMINCYESNGYNSGRAYNSIDYDYHIFIARKELDFSIDTSVKVSF